MDYFNKLKSRVQTVANQVNNALPGNPITREYEVLDQMATAGPGLAWNIYNGKKYSTNAPCSVWMFEKKTVEKWPRYERDIFLELLKQGVANLTRLRHPRLLVVEHSLIESRESYAFCTEPVFASLANVLGKTGSADVRLPAEVENFELLDVDIRHGLFQLAEALTFLHIDGKMLHRNVCPDSVIINEKGAWKLAGFDFSIQGTVGSSGKPSFEMLEWDPRTVPVVQPALDYLAPEYIVGGRCDMYSDMFSLGVLSFAVFNKCKAPFSHDNNVDAFKKNSEKLKHLQPNLFAPLPPEFRDDVKMCLNFTPDLRPDATQFSKIIYFDDILTKTLNYFDSLMQMDNSQKMQFFKGLPVVLEKFPKRPLLQKVMPYLAGEFGTPDLIPFILPSVFLIAELATKEEFERTVLPHLLPVFSMDRPYQIVLLLLQKMELLLQKTPDDQLKAYVLPLIYNAIGSETIKVQELCLSIIPSIGRLVDRNAMKNQLLAKLLKLAADGNVLSIFDPDAGERGHPIYAAGSVAVKENVIFMRLN
ncbi:hypothetical protein L596_014699 [Steinernema carpocapsae]|uniref:Protein kinase domain-containing protein n=1 Tax=Steinernema carpocapsae TaxID=34508 RepID=A0A4U5NDH4_STECR|nr:hypothetical protein L596_014699 [Steinernema carpocapsae]